MQNAKCKGHEQKSSDLEINQWELNTKHLTK
jgi:hypothetical protein